MGSGCWLSISGFLFDLFGLRDLNELVASFDEAGMLSEAQVCVVHDRDPLITRDNGYFREDAVRFRRDFLSGQFRFTVAAFRVRRRYSERAAYGPFFNEDDDITCE